MNAGCQLFNVVHLVCTTNSFKEVNLTERSFTELARTFKIKPKKII